MWYLGEGWISSNMKRKQYTVFNDVVYLSTCNTCIGLKTNIAKSRSLVDSTELIGHIRKML